eukprot:scaffold37355_cov78-Phaeocystis_antarctica.AAC.2
MSFVPSVMYLNVVRLVVARFGPTHHRLREEARAEVYHIAHRVCHAQGSRCVCECVLEMPRKYMCFSTASDPPARKWADAYRSMTDAHGQL